jgi:hypothetical protein
MVLITQYSVGFSRRDEHVMNWGRRYREELANLRAVDTVANGSQGFGEKLDRQPNLTHGRTIKPFAFSESAHR